MRRTLTISMALLCSFILLTESSAQDFWGINCGAGWYYTSPQGDVFSPDGPYSPGGFGVIDFGSIMDGPRRSTTGDEGLDSLYFFWRTGSFSYRFDVPAGQYAVTLYMAEKQFHWKDFRHFSVIVEDDTLYEDLDLFAAANLEQAFPIRDLVECNDGTINIDFYPILYYPCVAGIAVREISPDSSPPPTPGEFGTQSSYQMNIVYWNYVVANDLEGYRVYRREIGGDWTLLTPDTYRLYQYFDFDATVGVEYEYKVTSIDLWGNESAASESGTATAVSFESSTLPRYAFDITDDALHQLNIDIFSMDEVPADLTLEGVYFPDSEMRYRGSTIRIFAKKSYRFRLPEDETHNGWERFNLNSMYADESMIRDKLCYDLFDLIEYMSPATRMVHLERYTEDLDEFLGVYTEVERIDGDFLQRRGYSASGNLYKCKSTLSILPNYQAYLNVYIKVNNDSSDYQDIIDFIDWINTVPDNVFHQEIGQRFALDEYLDCYTVLTATQDVDFVGNNYYLYNNPVDNRWYSISWDHNESIEDPYGPINFGTREHPGAFGSWHHLLDRALEDSLFRYSYCKKLERYLDEHFTMPQLEARITDIRNQIEEDALRDYYKRGWGRPEPFYTELDEVLEVLELRIPFLQSEIQSYILEPELASNFRLNEIQTLNATTITDPAGDYDPWIEIYNTSAVELDLTGFELEYDDMSWILPEEAVVDGYGYLILWMDGEPGEGPLHSPYAITAASASLRLFSSTGQQADETTIPVLSQDQVWAREEDGVGDWSQDMSSTPGSTNTPLLDPSALVINEILAVNDNIIPDEAGDYEDWIEIYNPSGDTIPLAGLYLTDNLDDPYRWALPDTSIHPGQFLLIWCDNESWEGKTHATFKLNGGGEQVGLYHRDGVTPIDTITFGDQSGDISFGRYPDGSGPFYFCTPTPGDFNVGVEPSRYQPDLPDRFELKANYPNPFNPATTIRFALPSTAMVTLEVFDLQGRRVAELIHGEMRPGYHQVPFNAHNLASGIYFYRIEADQFSATRKMLLLK